ncbi:MAG: DUF4190 domain-containing protein [Pirellulaceae bacterium]
MPFHVPFEHRRPPQPIYIGFDAPPRRRPHNWTGFWGFLLGILGVFTAGLLSPLALLVSLVGMRKRPRGFATTGMILGLGGTLFLGGLAFAVHQAHEHRISRQIEQANMVKIEETQTVFQDAENEFADFANDNDGYLPDAITANMLAIKYEDAWGESLRFEESGTHGFLRSAGADSEFDTRDDVVIEIGGRLDSQRIDLTN